MRFWLAVLRNQRGLDCKMIFSVNNRGQVDQAITSVIVLFAAFFLMAIFVVVSGNIGKLLGVDEGIVFEGAAASSFRDFEEDDFIFNDVEVNGEEMWIINMILRWQNSEFGGRDIEKALIPLLDPFVSDDSPDGDLDYADVYGYGGSSVDGRGDNLNIINDCLGISFGSDENSLWKPPTSGSSHVLVERKSGEDPEGVTFKGIPRINDDDVMVKRFFYHFDMKRVYVEYYYQDCENVK